GPSASSARREATMKPRWLAALGLAVFFGGAVALAQTGHAAEDPPGDGGKIATALFAGGCFWCVEEAFDMVAGVVETTSGYTGATLPSRPYEQVSAGGTGRIESVRVRCDPAQVSYERLLDVFWRNVDPVDAGGQFCDRGDQYRSALFVATDAERKSAE